jgi:protein-tyrosine-phosphatase
MNHPRMFFFRKKFHLVIVCTANRTRSAYFAGYLKHYLAQYRPSALRKIRITSAGTKAAGGGRVNDVVALIARNQGFSLREHTAGPLSDTLVKRADLILVMEQEHKDFILEKWPESKEKVFRLMEYGWQADPEEASKTEVLDVPDPTGRNADDFKAFIETAHAEADRLIHELVHREIV